MLFIKKILDYIDTSLLEDNKEERNYLGASEIGHPCNRYLWFRRQELLGLHNVPIIHSVYNQRIFDMGKTLEPMVLSWLNRIGYKKYIDYFEPSIKFKDIIIKGHYDALVKLTPTANEILNEFIIENSNLDEVFIVEIKALNKSSWDKINAEENLKDVHEQYYIQVMMYLHLYKAISSRCIFVALNKDNANICMKFINYDENFIDIFFKRVEDIFNLTKEQLPFAYNSKSFQYKRFCEHCKFKNSCH